MRSAQPWRLVTATDWSAVPQGSRIPGSNRFCEMSSFEML